MIQWPATKDEFEPIKEVRRVKRSNNNRTDN